jgi:hypothetical protein
MVNAPILIYGIIFGVSLIVLLDGLGRRMDRQSKHRHGV